MVRQKKKNDTVNGASLHLVRHYKTICSSYVITNTGRNIAEVLQVHKLISR